MLENSILKLLAVDGMEGEGIETNVDNSVDNVDNPVGGVEQKDTSEVETPQFTEIDLDGEKLTLDQIRQLKQTNASATELYERSSKLTRIEQEYNDAIELFNYLKNKPELAQQLYDLDNSLPKDKIKSPYDDKIAALEQKMYMKEVEADLKEIVAKDKDVKDIEILQIATQNNCSVKNAYNIWKGQNFDKILEKRLAEQSKQITENIKKNNGVTKTIITEGDTTNDKSATHGLSDVELAFAKKVGMTPEEYSKWKQ